MDSDQQALLLEKTSSILSGTYDFRELAQRAVSLIVKELGKYNLIGAAIFRVHEQDNALYAYTYSTKYRQTIEKLLPIKFARLSVPLLMTGNLIVRTAVTGQTQQSKRIADFSRGVVPETITDKIQKVMGGRLGVSFPVKIKNEKVSAVIMLILNEEKLTGQQLVLFDTFANQLGLALSNVMEFEKLQQKYRRIVDRELKSRSEAEDQPSMRFTLRISPKQDRLLEKAAREKGKTKTEIIRDLIDKL